MPYLSQNHNSTVLRTGGQVVQPKSLFTMPSDCCAAFQHVDRPHYVDNSAIDNHVLALANRTCNVSKRLPSYPNVDVENQLSTARPECVSLQQSYYPHLPASRSSHLLNCEVQSRSELFRQGSVPFRTQTPAIRILQSQMPNLNCSVSQLTGRVLLPPFRLISQS